MPGFAFNRESEVLPGNAPRKLRGSRLTIILIAVALLGVAVPGAMPSAHAQQCATNPSNGGILQSGGTCVDNNPVTTGFGNAVDVSNNANVTENAAIVANGGGNGIVASTGAIDTVNGNVNAANIALSAASGSTIIANNIALGNTGGGAMAVLSNNATVILNNVSMNWPNGFGAALVDATNGGLIQFSNSSIIVPSGSVPSVLLADGAGSRIVANDFLTLQIGVVGRARGLGQGNTARHGAEWRNYPDYGRRQCHVSYGRREYRISGHRHRQFDYG